MVRFTKKKTILDSNPKPQGNELAPEPMIPERSRRAEGLKPSAFLVIGKIFLFFT